MLHLEMYSGELEGPLTQMGRPFDRREDLIDPTPYLDRLVHTVANVIGERYTFRTDRNGARFLVPHKKFLIDL
jgi:hypothetical protein